MTLLFYPDAGDWVERIRLGPAGFSLSEAAESGVFAMSNIQVDDPDSDVTIVGHHIFRAVETACSWKTLFRGYFTDRTIKRGEGGGANDRALRLGTNRVWDCSVIDANATLQFEVIRGSAANRPAETDTERIAWILGSAFKGPISSDDTNVLGYDVDLDKADYRGQTMADVLTDCATASKANFWVEWDDPAGEYRLHYYRPDRAYNSSTLRISNVLSDVDYETTFAPLIDAKMVRDPSRIFSGIYYGYGEKNSFRFEESSSVLAAIGHRRETAEVDQAVRTGAQASRKAERWLEQADTDEDTVSVVLPKVPPSKVNLIRAGQRIQIKMSHMPGLTSFTWMRVTRRTIEQDGETQEFYRLYLELANPKQMGNRKKGKPQPVEPDVVDGVTLTSHRWIFFYKVGRDDGHGGVADETDFDGPDGAIHDTVSSMVNYSTPYIFAGCSFGVSGWSGVEYEEQWFSFDPGDLDNGELGVLVDVEIDWTEGVAAARGLSFGVGTGTPTAAGDFTYLGSVGSIAAGDHLRFLIPRFVLTPNTTHYAVVAPGWAAQEGVFACGDTLTDSSGPVYGGDFESGRVGTDSWSIKTQLLDGNTGWTSWIPPSGDVDGSNRTFELQDWNGKGTPRVSVNGIELTNGEDYTYDKDALTVTLTAPPWAGADVRVRYTL